jgi:hypothetical protein
MALVIDCKQFWKQSFTTNSRFQVFVQDANIRCLGSSISQASWFLGGPGVLLEQD